MRGASELDPAFLEGKYLLNCDHDNGDGFCIGCAGGARQTFTFAPRWEKPSGSGVAIRLSGMPGGHSGVCIHLDRGNAIRLLAEFLDLHPDIEIAGIESGRVDNAIPTEAAATGSFAGDLAELRKSANAFAVLAKRENPNAAALQIDVDPAPAPEAVWDADSRRRIVSALALAPDGVIAWSEEFDVPRDSSNLAMVHAVKDKVVVSTSQRSLADAERDRTCALIDAHFAMFGAVGQKGNVYPATAPKSDSALLELAVETWADMGHKTGVNVIHAGLETGWFSLKNPDLEILSCGPHLEEYHTPRERAEIASVAEFDRFLRRLLGKLALHV